MSPVTDSSAQSSSSRDLDDFSVSLDKELECTSPCSKDPEDDHDLESVRIKKLKVEKLESIEEPQASTSYKSLEQKSEVSRKKDGCAHPGSFGDMCILCGKRLGENYGVTFEYIHKGLRLGNDEIDRLRNINMKNLLRDRKLCLVLDLDHTLINSTLLEEPKNEKDYLRFQIDYMKGNLVILKDTNNMMMTKLRPFVHTFLKEANRMFEMYIYTMGQRTYAFEIAKLLDPKGEYFTSRVISRDDGTVRNQKDLDVVLGQESTVLILDDTEQVWPKHKDNLILMLRYHYFSWSSQVCDLRSESLAEMQVDESEEYGVLAKILEVLKNVHATYFKELDDNHADVDVRQVVKKLRKEILKGCTIIFSHIFPIKFPNNYEHSWKLAEDLGATCVTEVEHSGTHMVLTDVGDKPSWAETNKLIMVHPLWIKFSYLLWQRLPEADYPVRRLN